MLRSQKFQLRLIASPEMSEKGESNTIRFSLKARDKLGLQPGSTVRVGVGDYQLDLKAKKARREDVKRLANMLARGRMTERESLYAGFVTKSVQQRIARRRDEGTDIWLSAASEPITIGADPEFGLISSNGYLYRADDVLPKAGRFGSDGPGAEVRPAASRNYEEVVSNIKHILSHAPAAVEPYKWLGGATFVDPTRKYWFGGHIHFGRPAALDPDCAMDCYVGIAKALDHMLALPYVRLDTPNPSFRRNGCQFGYGKAGTFNSGGSDASVRASASNFEYRVLSGLWLIHPDLAKATLGTAKCIAESVYSRCAANGFDPEWVSAPFSRKGLAKSLGLAKAREVTALINRAIPSNIREEHLKAWKKQIRELDFYDEYRTEIEALVALVREARPDSFNLDLRRGWLDAQPLASKASRHLRSCVEKMND